MLGLGSGVQSLGCKVGPPLLVLNSCQSGSVRTGSWTGPPRGKRAPRVEIKLDYVRGKGVRAPDASLKPES